MEKAPYINDDLTYSPNPNGKEIRVYDAIDTRMTIDDFFKVKIVLRLMFCINVKANSTILKTLKMEAMDINRY